MRMTNTSALVHFSPMAALPNDRVSPISTPPRTAPGMFPIPPSTAAVNAVRSIQSRVSSFLAAGLMIALGVGGLSWYYANALGRQSRAREAAASVTTNKAQGDAPLPPLGGVEAPHPVPSAPFPVQGADINSFARNQYPQQALPPLVPAPVLPLAPDPYTTPQRQVPSDRRLSGATFARCWRTPGTPSTKRSMAPRGWRSSPASGRTW